MFGKVRASSCPAESLERPPSKILKDDSLSIYEATLMKLKLGSKRNLSPCEIDNGSTSSSSNLEPMKIDVNCASAAASQGNIEVASSPQEQEEFMTLDTDCSSVTSSTSSTDCHSLGTSKQQQSTNVSVLYLFSKFKRAQEDICSSSGDAMTIESASISPSSSGCQSLNSTEQHLEKECVDSLPARHICML
ncbi:unnamed protein product [Prunus armeniaca]|uniref:Uncharacterized protein n=1 Tax=Prunus armeniaca TaxID=36596 RepID=A0A6J5UX93_PRUAR|nr:hypothetical protein GBA52_017264 [Prunus armeniaca]CAB4280561.1 unnamed protein product [Prunus armeniaca]CAB4310976.1 unnamed protein product [Prunus armeniaca]